MYGRPAGTGGRGGTCDVHSAPANKMFTCHMCKRQQNQGQTRIAIRDPQNPSGWNHFCSVCWQTEQAEGAQPVRRGPWDSDGTLGRGYFSPAAESGGGGSTAGHGASGGACCGADDVDGGGEEEEEMEEEGEEKGEGGDDEDDEDDGEEEEVEDDFASANLWSNDALQVAVAAQLKAVHRHLPTISPDGRLIPPKAAAGDACHTSAAGTPAALNGNGKGKSRGPSPAAVAAAFKKKFPQAPICRPIEDVEARALDAMRPTAALKKKATAQDGSIDQVKLDELLREAAMSVFATNNVVVAVYAHEVIFFGILVRDKRFRVRTTAVRRTCLFFLITWSSFYYLFGVVFGFVQ